MIRIVNINKSIWNTCPKFVPTSNKHMAGSIAQSERRANVGMDLTDVKVKDRNKEQLVTYVKLASMVGVLGGWVALCYFNDGLYLKEAVLSSMVIGVLLLLKGPGSK